jgi:hypothetical protein
MRLKVVDMYGDGDLECYGQPTRMNGDCWYRVSRYNICRAFGVDDDLPDAEVMAALKGKEFDCWSLIPATYIASTVKAASEDRWTLHDVNCKYCESKVCGCEQYEPMETAHV